MSKGSPTKKFSLRRVLRLALRFMDERKLVEAQQPAPMRGMLCVAITFEDRLCGELLARYCDHWLEVGADAGDERECLRSGLRRSWEQGTAGDADRLFEIALLFFFSSQRADHDVAQEWCRECADCYENRQDAEAQFRLALLYQAGWGRQKDKTRAIACLRAAAEAGHADAAYEMGVICWAGDELPQSDSEAEKWFRLAAEWGSPLVLQYLYSLGVRYMMGHEVEKDQPRSRRWFDLAAQLGHPQAAEIMAMHNYPDGQLTAEEQERQRYWQKRLLHEEEERAQNGDAEAQLLLALRYEHGDGVEADAAMATKWFEESFRSFLHRARHDDPQGEAAHGLAQCYLFGQGTVEDCNKAAEWFAKAGEAGNFMAFTDLAILLLDNERVVGMTPQQIATWIKQARKLENVDAVDMFCNYAVRRGADYEWRKEVTEESCRLAVEWYSVAANADNVSAQVSLAQLYESGCCSTPDLALAEFWYSKAAIQNQRLADSGNPYAQRDLACLYENGKGVRQDDAMAKMWFKKAAATFRERAEKGDPAAQCELADMFCCGAGVDFDPEEAEKWYRLACAKGLEQAEKHYGNFCMKMGCICLGLDDPDSNAIDHHAAVKWLRKGAKLGNTHAIDALDYLQQQNLGE
ncbi:MAG: sel1 repeat family protein [Lentisphaerae bacterium]|nr:sel1 repeat family protein [Lentisphaerota bacterium]